MNAVPEPGDLRSRLVALALQWQERYGVAPAITSTLSELDAAMLLGMTEDEYQADCSNRSAVTRGFDFAFRGCRYQVKANRPSGRPGSFVTLVGKARNYDWDRLIWILYDRGYVIQEAWEWTADEYKSRFDAVSRLSPSHMRTGRCIFPEIDAASRRKVLGPHYPQFACSSDRVANGQPCAERPHDDEIPFE